MGKRALITGITGQDGALLAELLMNKGYQVYGIKRRSSSFNTERVDHLYIDPHKDSQFHMMYGDMTDATNLIRIVQEVQPNEIYNLAAQSHVQVSFETAEYTANSDALGTLRLLEAICIQHEIDHLNGVTILDKEIKLEPIKVSKSYGRNEIVMITDGKETKDLKYKKAKPLIDSGEWELYVGGPLT